MKRNKSKGQSVANGEFRRLAEEQLERSAAVGLPLHEDEKQRLVHELEVHQIELEMQSDELRLAQEKLELSRDKYTELYDFAPVGYFTFNAQGLIQEINLAGASLLGIERELLADIPISRFIADAEGKKVFSCHLKNVLQKKDQQGCEIKLTQKNGQVIHTQIQSTALGMNESQGSDILSSIVDVTVAKELESEIQDAREYSENIVETLRAPLLVLDSDLQILTANHCFYETFKVTAEETIGKFIYDVGNRQWDIPQLRLMVEEILPQNKVIKDYEVEHDFPGIGHKVILISARQIFREKIGSNIILLDMEDITERRQLEMEIQEAREYAENIVETLREPLVVLNVDLKILTANHSFYEVFKVTPEETIGNFIYDIGNRQWDIPQLRLLVEEILPLDTVINGYEVEHDFPGIGHKFILLNARQIFREKIGSDIILLAMEDITERKQAESALLQAGALQSAIFHSANFSSIATDEKGVIQIFNVGAEKMLGYTAAEVVNKNTPADISDPQEIIARAQALSTELETEITPGFDALVFKARRGIEDIYELTYIRKDGSRFPAVVSVTALRDDQETIIGYLLIGTDNTARKQAEEALLQAGALQSAIFNSANFSSIATDEKGVIQIFNVGAERMLGYTAAEVVNKNTPADISDPQEIIARAQVLSTELETEITPGFDALVFKARRGIEDIYELTYIRKDGSRFPAVVSVTALRDGQGTIIGYLLIGTDNTARKQAEEALLQAGALQRAIFNSANFSSIATDAEGVIQIFNVGAEKMLGYSAAEVVNKNTPADISDPQEIIIRAQALSTELETEITPGFDALVFKARRGIEDIYELTYIRKDGSRFPAMVSVTALRDDQETIIGYLLIGTDNTARKQIEEEQKELSQLLQDQQFYTRNLIEANLDAISTTDPTGSIIDVNKQMEALTGCSREELIGAPFKDYFTDPSLVEDGIKQVLKEINISNYELTARARDGKETAVSFNANIFYDRDDKLQGIFFGARDVTERKRLDKVLLEKNIELESSRSVAEKANLAKSDFLSSMSHELRTPLGAILGFAQLMESGNPEPTPAQKRSIDQILKAGWYLLELINEILDLALIESGKLSLSLEPVSLEEVLRECEVMVEPQAKERNLRVVFSGVKVPYFVSADRTRVKQILINLLSNAIKYNKEYGSITVTCKETTPDFIRISVRDTGAGLTKEQLAQLFQPFNRLGQKGDVEEGTGIGLVVCKRLVESMGGVIGFDSTVGEGSVFWFELIRTKSHQASTHIHQFTTIAAPEGQAVEQSTLLYVEDNPANLMLVEDLLARRPDIRFLSAQDAIKGVEIARTSQPDVILMDINLPGISGIDALKILAEIPETAHIPVIALSANAIPRDIEKGLEAGFFRYLTKPIKVTEFMATLDTTLMHAKTEAVIAAEKGKTKK